MLRQLKHVPHAQLVVPPTGCACAAEMEEYARLITAGILELVVLYGKTQAESDERDSGGKQKSRRNGAP